MLRFFFSATLLPVQYYKELLTNKTDNYAVYAKTTFSQDKRLLLIGNDVSSKYTRRTPEEYGRIADYIYRTIKKKKGQLYGVFPILSFPEKKCMRHLNCGWMKQLPASVRNPACGKRKEKLF